ncbi:LysR family transcriptional regulator [Mycolicibacterium sp. 050158]|uniref:LysR family transcriptional regulator n=1 Tax=Mycolicibacterium sp. 050158 TaxID=3090602 RepID=UPI00299E3E28|nr:LysR family transcriptional regulator [Mycolicibacterium sp. 050158]MDX1888876.1 LysR family transcriptional regulator [Mycolicibacterium sp. 050158]
MELRQLDHFVAVADELNFTRAAARVHVVQSALSTSIAKLERELGTALFDRTRQQITLTPAGLRFRVHAQEVRRSVRRAAGSVDEFRGTLSGTVEFGSLISFGPMDVAGALGDFHRLHPYVRLRLRLSQSGASAYLAALIEGALDLALVSVPDRFPPQLDMRLLFEEPMVFVCCRDHTMAKRKIVSIADLADEELVGFPPGFGLRRLVDDALRTVGADPHTRYEVPAGFAAIAELVGNGLGTAFMPVSEARRFPDLPSVKLSDPVTWQVFLASPPAARMAPATAALADLLLDAAVRARGR